MKTETKDIFDTLRKLLSENSPPLKIRIDTAESFEVSGTKEAMQGKQKVDGFFFAKLICNPKDVTMYYFPIYTHEKDFAGIPASLKNA